MKERREQLNERSNLIHRLCESVDSRASYIKAKLGVLVPSQIRALRLRSDMPRQMDLAQAAGLHQSRISMFETPGAANMTLETLARLAAAFKVGLIVEFVPFSEMLRSENEYSQDGFYVTPITRDHEFLNPEKVNDPHHDVVDLLLANWSHLSNGASRIDVSDLQQQNSGDQRKSTMSSVVTEGYYKEVAQRA